ncbi:DUF3426 domain-containing protein [Chromobacterium sp. CV08]|uniref:DUF3426 domain-containing protein n=1 Tax=Chromobacterium sp. CV08 TaxID=3133274 RepID=UPI003DA7ADE3
MTYTTQCPNCQTRFKVNDSQLAAANGLVRCGRCSHVFRAPDHFVAAQAAPAAMSAAPAPAERDPIDDFELEVPDFDPQAQQAEEAVAEAEAPAEPEAPPQQELEAFQRALAEAMQNRHATAPIGNPFDEPAAAPEPEVFGSRRRAETTPEPAAEPPRPAVRPLPEPEPPLFTDADAEQEDEARRHRRSAPWLNGVLAALGVLGLLFLAAQLVYINRTRIAAEVPESRPALERLCQSLGCEVPWPTDISRIRTEWSELAFVPDYPNLIQLSATLKNHAQYAQAYPMLEVTLKDSDDQVLIRKVFTPKEYLKPDDFKLGRFNPNSESRITMRLDAGKVHAMGYSLYWFYP